MPARLRDQAKTERFVEAVRGCSSITPQVVATV
jgi:hypothetical protein